MIEHNVYGASSNMGLVGAILLYRGMNTKRQETTFATVHSVDGESARPIIRPGRPMTESDLTLIHNQLVESKAVENATRWHDNTVLASGRDRIIWWTPASTRTMYFKPTKADLEQGMKTSAKCPTPALVWMRTSESLYLFALKQNERPTQDTELFQAPFWNVWETARVCVGSAKSPDSQSEWDTNAWERMFFESNFTHPNIHGKGRLISGKDPWQFWKTMSNRPKKVFPVEVLISKKLTVAKLMSVDIESQLNAAGRLGN
jgi:PRTRC genetic system protein B